MELPSEPLENAPSVSSRSVHVMLGRSVSALMSRTLVNEISAFAVDERSCAVISARPRIMLNGEVPELTSAPVI